MALTNAEKQARWRERQRAKAAGLLPEKEAPEPLMIPTPVALADFVKGQDDELREAFEWMQEQLDLPVGQFLSSAHKEHEIEWTRNIITDIGIALETITATFSEYQVAMIDREIARLRDEGTADPAKLDGNLDMILRYKALRNELKRSHRLNLRNHHFSDR